MKYCEAYALEISAFLDGELNEEERAAVLAHVEACEGCRAYLAELTAMQAALGGLEEYDAPEGFAAGVMERLHQESAPAKRHAPRRAWYTLAACAAVVILAASVFPRMGNKSADMTAECCAAPEAAMGTECAPSEEETEYLNAYTSVQSDGAVSDSDGKMGIMPINDVAECGGEPETTEAASAGIPEAENALQGMPRSVVFVYGAEHEDYLIEAAVSFDYYADGTAAGYDLPVEKLDEFLALLEADGLEYDESVTTMATTFYVQYEDYVRYEEGEAANG